MREVFIIGSKGIPAQYGGFETFVDELVSRQKTDKIRYHVAGLKDGGRSQKKPHVAGLKGEDRPQRYHRYHQAELFEVKVPKIGAARAVLYDIQACRAVIKYAKAHKLTNGTLYVLACRIGPVFGHYVRRLHRLGFKVYVNPDGHEWLRAKWNALIKKYWKWSERLMVKHADLLICDSQQIEKYIKKTYAKYRPQTRFIAYGADVKKSQLQDGAREYVQWQQKHQVVVGEYYLVVGRFVPENNYSAIIRGFMKSPTQRDLVIITNVEKNKFYRQLSEETGFERDGRIKFVGTVYDKDLLKKIRQDAVAYIHGHSVGGTNPSLLEALAVTDVNMLYDCGFNREVAAAGAVYFRGASDLAKRIDEVEKMDAKRRNELQQAAVKRINDGYSWDKIVAEYEEALGE